MLDKNYAKDMYDYLPIGKKNAISKEELVKITGMNERSVREMIAEIRMSYGAVCSTSTSKGYYKPASKQELQEFIDETERRAKSTFAILKIAKEEMNRNYGQLEFGF